MDALVIEGGRRLEGTLRVLGSKNAALPIMAAALLTDEPVSIREMPDLADTRNMLRLLAELGCHRVNEAAGPAAREYVLHTTDPGLSHARYDIVKTMRASICVLGPMLARRGHARISMPGGCAFGHRPVDLHLKGLAALGASISLENGDIIAKAPGGRLRGTRVFLGGPFGSTVLGTANVMSAACLAEGVTIIESAACEPEVVDLARMLTTMGARIHGAGSPRITIEGVTSLRGCTHNLIPDRIEAGTLMCAAAMTNGTLVLENCPLDALMAATAVLEQVGVHVRVLGASDAMRATVRVTSERVLRPSEITTQPHPGFPTDLQAQFMALFALAEGNSVITEKIYPERFMHVAELARMGAQMVRQGPTVIVAGVKRLIGAPVMASDLRASASLVLAGLAAEGTTTVSRVYHLDRGYEKLDERLRSVGASITRIDEKAGPASD
ncbi:MAG: UDP-N-acetylglucosamine 1-carboxyvinyltransferase [Phycisphaerales bacterium]|jgi:UDP-N-acetylglucosamine 1-carboxyvinyltransferase|nr:UDP-N-acetylglucosamine 1-carboxyvinyltransferase [Phycisphaerales bacterium]